jgi:hypothetical protein
MRPHVALAASQIDFSTLVYAYSGQSGVALLIETE